MVLETGRPGLAADNLRKRAEHWVMVCVCDAGFYSTAVQEFNARKNIETFGALWNGRYLYCVIAVQTYLTKVTFTWRLADLILLTVRPLLTLNIIAQGNI